MEFLNKHEDLKITYHPNGTYGEFLINNLFTYSSNMDSLNNVNLFYRKHLFQYFPNVIYFIKTISERFYKEFQSRISFIDFGKYLYLDEYKRCVNFPSIGDVEVSKNNIRCVTIKWRFNDFSLYGNIYEKNIEGSKMTNIVFLNKVCSSFHSFESISIIKKIINFLMYNIKLSLKRSIEELGIDKNTFL